VILLITFFPWDSAQGGAFIMRNNLQQLKGEQIDWFALSRPSGKVPFSAANVKYEFRSPPARGNVRLRLGRFWRWYQRQIWSVQITRLLERRIRDLNPRVVWLMADYGLAPVGLRLLPHLKRRRLHISFHDSPRPTAERECCSSAFLNEVDAFLDALNELDFTADAVTEELLAECAPAAQCKAIVTLPVNRSRSSPEFTRSRSEGTLEIGFSGNFLGEEEFACFIDGLRLWEKKSGRNWKMTVVGRPDLARFDQRVDAHGPMSSDNTQLTLSSCDLLLLPSPIDRPEMRTNMPTKLVTYLELGRMILAFAPKDSSTARVLSEARLGPVLSVRSPEAVADALQEIGRWDFVAASYGWHQLVTTRFDEARIARDLESCLYADYRNNRSKN
jgi:hypothetical protein